jgi:hypothetical protein
MSQCPHRHDVLLLFCFPFSDPICGTNFGNSQFAVLLVMFNKAALSSYKFPCANVITLLQVLDVFWQNRHASCTFLDAVRERFMSVFHRFLSKHFLSSFHCCMGLCN